MKRMSLSLRLTACGVAVTSAVLAGQAQAGLNAENMPACHSIKAVFAPRTGRLTITGDAGHNTIIVGRNAAGIITVNNGTVPVRGGVPTIGNTAQILIQGNAGNDQIALDETHGPLPPAHIEGGPGDDDITGGSGPDTLEGGAGRDILRGMGGIDLLSGGPGDDIHIGGPGEDSQVGGPGNDFFVINPEDGSDIIEGRNGQDVIVFNGSDYNEIFQIQAVDGRLHLFRNIGPVFVDSAGIEEVRLFAGGGTDAITVHDMSSVGLKHVLIDVGDGPSTTDTAGDSVTIHGTPQDDEVYITGDARRGVVISGLPATVNLLNNEAVPAALQVSLGDGNDSLDASRLEPGLVKLSVAGGNHDDWLIGSAGSDFLAGDSGTDIVLGGGGDDFFAWKPGDGSDVLEGQDGADRLEFTASNVNEVFDVSANGSRIRFARDIGGVIMDCDGIEVIHVVAQGGADTVRVSDTTGTALLELLVNLFAANGTSFDGARDVVLVQGTPQNDVVQIFGGAEGAAILGLNPVVTITGSEGASDQVSLSLLAGDDILDASSLPGGIIQLVADGDEGNDVLLGSDGHDILLGGPGDDFLRGGPGLDVLDGGSGDNVLIQD